ncbi:hypothetical protein [Vibrio owensii]|uniref:hypothetical protein n=1 Tax=Vibrio owensii TaxID=696485 RepID=UPI0018F24DDE|nr:hypothetical protein [Vibrio owensii]
MGEPVDKIDWASIDWGDVVKRYSLFFMVSGSLSGAVVIGFWYLFNRVLLN